MSHPSDYLFRRLDLMTALGRGELSAEEIIDAFTVGYIDRQYLEQTARKRSRSDPKWFEFYKAYDALNR